MEQQLRQQIRIVIDIFFRRKKLITACLLIAMTLGLGNYLNTAKFYQSSASIIFERGRVNPTKMSPDVQSRFREMVATLSQQVLARGNLEEIILQFDLYPESRAVMPIEDVIARMRTKDIYIRQDKGGDTFTVTFQSTDPKKTMLVTNALAAKFIEENMRYREERVSETSAYVKDELRMAKISLDEKEAIMRDYKLKHYNEMADRQGVNMGHLNSLQMQAQTTQTSIQDMERTRVMIQEQISLRKEVLTQAMMQSQTGAIPTLETPPPPAVHPDVIELQRAQSQLDSLMIRYTASHPEVKRTQGLVALLEERVKKLPPTIAPAPAPAPTPTPTPTPTPSIPVASPRGFVDEKLLLSDRQISELSRQLSDIEFNVNQLKKDQVNIRQDIAKYQGWVEMAPVREAEWSALTRDYEQLSRHYQDLVASNLSAESAESLEKRQKGSQFKIIDPAHFPVKPFKPNFLFIMLIGVAGGLLVGGSLALALEFTDTSFKDARDMENYLNTTVLCSIPLINTASEKRSRRFSTIAWGLSFFIYIDILIVLVIVLLRKGTIIL